MRVCGDWVFYLHIIRGGLVAYTPECVNQYRQHQANTSVNAQSETIFYREHETVVQHLVSLYRLDKGLLERLLDNLTAQWLLCRSEFPASALAEHFDIERARKQSMPRRPNLLMITYSLIAGGGETFPLMLANLMHERGYSVAVLNCNEQSREAGVRNMLRRNIPLFQLNQIIHAVPVIEDLGIEVIHSHHAWADLTLATILQNDQLRHVITMHGMYEMMSPSEFERHRPLIERKIDRIVYTAEKNLKYFPVDFQQKKAFIRIDNALPDKTASALERSELGVGKDDFVLCLVSRAIPEKGWAEAIDAVCQAHSSRKIHLLLIGEGPELVRLKAQQPPENIHFLGFRENIRDYFALSDIGFIPSRFQGESFPLVLIDCLRTGKPVLASSIGEIPSMLASDSGLAGVLFDLEDWQIPLPLLTGMIEQLAEPGSPLYAQAWRNVPSAAQKFDPEIMCEKYHAVYSGLIDPTYALGRR